MAAATESDLLASAPSQAVVQAEQILGGYQVSVNELLALVSTLWADGRRQLARELLDRVGERILAGQEISADDLLKLVKKGLKAERRFGLARKLLDRFASRPEVREDAKRRLDLGHQRSLCTYKDPDLPTDERLDLALSILREVDDLATTTNQETLGQAGAIYKRKWELTAQERFLETSLAYYLRGYHQGVAGDFGYTAVNAAFVLDLLAALEEGAAVEAAVSSRAVDARRERARQIRTDIVSTLPPLAERQPWLEEEWWFLVTLGEAHFGLGQYATARQWLTRARGLRGVPDWEWESTARQLAALLPSPDRRRAAATSAGGESEAVEVLREFLGGSFAAVTSIARGKFGLALSGGGFRASLFHVGVLAKLAELDLLRHAEYLSCVSGGSIIGAHYYLEVRKLLQDKADGEITRQDYIDIVRRVERDFLAGVERNIRTRILGEWATNLRMVFQKTYSRTMRAGELYESELFSRVADGEGQRERWLNDLFIRPKDDPDIVPKDHNWRRSAKVPILVLNATSLNTGHNWQFTASWMGEPPGPINSEIDANYRLRRMYFRQLPEERRRVRLGYAVAASACVPGLFEPLPLPGLYESPRVAGANGRAPITVQLVDGGVHDNQGVASLLEQGCTVLLVSDASGQMDDQDQPSNGLLGVPLRANSILQARVREAQFRDLDARRRAGLLRGLMFIHLKQGLDSEPVDWIDCQDPSEPRPVSPLLPYGIQRGIQRRLAAIRTDLDSFSEAEAYALMSSGYSMAEHALRGSVLGFPVEGSSRLEWEFRKIEPLMSQPGEDSALSRQLRVSDQLFLRAWRLVPGLTVAGGAGLGLLAILIAALAWRFWSVELVSLTVGGVVTWAGGIVLSVMGLKWLLQVVRAQKTLQQILLGIGMTLAGALLARLHLHVFDRKFLTQARLSRLLTRK